MANEKKKPTAKPVQKPCKTEMPLHKHTYVEGSQSGNTTSENVKKAQDAVNKLKGGER